MLHKRRFGKRGVVALVTSQKDFGDAELMGRADAAALQFGVTRDYAFDLFIVRHPMNSTYARTDLLEKFGALLGERKYKVIVLVGPEVFTAYEQVHAVIHRSPMIIGVNTQAAIDANAPEQYEMQYMNDMFRPNLSKIVRVCLEKNLSQEEGVEYIRKYEAERVNRSWGLFDEAYVLIKTKGGREQVVRFENREDAILPPAPETPFVGRARVILFSA